MNIGSIAAHEILTSDNETCRIKTLSGRACINTECGESWNLVARVLYETYGEPLVVTLSEPSSSLVIRSEHHFQNEDRHRLSVRKHIFTRRSPNGLELSSGLKHQNCGKSPPTETLSDYIGFIDHRPTEPKFNPGIAMAVLKPPFRNCRDTATYLILDDYGPFFGGAAFLGSVYSTHDEFASGALCAQACMVMMLGLLMNRGALMVGPYDLTYLARKDALGPPNDLTDGDARCLAASELLPQGWFHAATGLRAIECVHALSDSRLRVSPHLIEADGCTPENDAVLREVIKGCVIAQLPLTLFVDSKRWFPDDLLETLRPHNTDDDQTATNNSHTVCIVGFMEKTRGFKDYRLVVHDPGVMPYWTRSLRSALDAAWFHKVDSNQYSLALVLVGDLELKCNPFEAIMLLLRSPDHGASVRRYLEVTEDLEDGNERKFNDDRSLSIRLFSPEEILQFFANARDEFYLKSIRDALVSHSAVRYWVIIGRGMDGMLKELWFFDANKEIDVAKGWSQRETGLAFWVRIQGQSQDVDILEGSRCRQLGAQPNNEPVPTTPLVPIWKTGAVSDATPSAITSSSYLPLPELVRQLDRVNDVRTIDLFLLRETDIAAIDAEGPALTVADGRTGADRSIAEILANEANLDRIVQWYAKTLQPENKERGPLRISALATYLPHISAINNQRWSQAVAALRSCVRIGFNLRSHNRVAFDPVVIEIVCGSFVERCDCASCERAQRCFVYSATAKRQRILEALTVVLNDCKKERSSGQLAFAIELEPGVSYVVQDRDSLVDIVKSIAASSLEDAVGLNLDFAHMRAAGLSPSSLDSTLLRQVVHAHICDLPGVHTRDQEVGRWSPIYDDGTDEYFDYMRAFRFSGLMPKRILPYSGTIAVELEGCGRSKWLHNSLLAVKHLSSR